MNADDLTEVVDKYSTLLEEVYFHPVIFFVYVGILGSAFIARGIVWYKINKDLLTKDKRRQYLFYVVSHVLIEMLFALIIGYIIIKLTSARWDNYIINMIAAPGAGFLGAVIFDNKLLLKLEEESNKRENRRFKFSSGTSDIEVMDDKKEEKVNGNTNNIIFNVNSTPTMEGTIEQRTKLTNSVAPLPLPEFRNDIDDKLDKIKNLTVNEDTIEEDFGYIVNIIQDMNKNHQELSNEIKEIRDRQGNIAETIDAIRETMMTDKKHELKKLIYKCLDQGYATPEQNEVISANYRNYCSMHGNGEIKSLYEERYLKLEIHEDRRKEDIPVKYDRRKKKRDT